MARLHSLADKVTARVLQRYFKTDPGGYGEGDVFLGIRMPELRRLAKKFCHTSTTEVMPLLGAPEHEARMLALLILVNNYKSGPLKEKKRIYKAYMANIRFINNWDLVDCSATRIVGPYLMDKDKTPLYRLARSRSLWRRRIAIMATFHFIKHGEFDDTFALSRVLLNDTEDLIHKAVGWMLREVGKRKPSSEEGFLKVHYRAMPRTMLRYALERFPEKKRQGFLKGRI